ncbi:hypothetical protein IYO05_004028 [Escherichia coli]|uniref:hypothetical protein n=1 Tax=Escherichia coli TaxID=562 RepID=UPI0019DA2F8B|nr:hypothetical protein [Escherichia coli]HDI9948307.1 hypothetical protein [Escherichia coli]
MSNNCCTSSLVEGGTLLEPRIINGELQSPSVKGSITLDEPALLALSAQLCAVLSDCIEREIHGGSFNDVTLRDAELHSAKLITAALEGAVTLNDAAKKSIADAVGPELTTHVLKIVSENKIADAKLSGASLSGGITLDKSVSQAIADAVGPLLQKHIIDAVTDNGLDGIQLRDVDIENARLSGTLELVDGAKTLLHAALSDLIKKQADTLISSALTSWEITGNNLVNISAENLSASNTRLSGTTSISGQVPLDTAAHDHLVKQLTNSIREIADAAIVADKDVLAGVFQDCDGAPRAPGVRIPSCQDVTDAINQAIASLPALDVISGFTYDEDTHTLKLTTKLNNDGGPQSWEVNLDSIGGQVVTDGTTITGTGVTGQPLKLVIAETTKVKAVTKGAELPTAIHGGRTALLGQPDKWIDIGGYLIPAFNKP